MKQPNDFEVSDIDFTRISGPKSSAAANSEELMSQILTLEIDAQAIDGRGGDLGKDCYIGRASRSWRRTPTLVVAEGFEPPTKGL